MKTQNEILKRWDKQVNEIYRTASVCDMCFNTVIGIVGLEFIMLDMPYSLAMGSVQLLTFSAFLIFIGVLASATLLVEGLTPLIIYIGYWSIRTMRPNFLLKMAQRVSNG